MVLFEKNAFKNLKLSRRKYLSLKKYLEDLRRCKMKFWTTFVFCTMLIFQLFFELERFENFRKYFDKKILSYFSKLPSSKRSGKINMVQKTKVVRNSILHLLGSSKYFSRLKYFFPGNFKFLNAFFSKRTTKHI